MSREQSMKDSDECMKGICKGCGSKMRHYRKLDGSLWVHYEICDCGRMTNFTRRYVSNLENIDAFLDHLRSFTGWRVPSCNGVSIYQSLDNKMEETQ